MPALDLSHLTELSLPELQNRRADIVARIAATPGGDENASTEDLIELAAVTKMLRQKNAGPPKEKKPSAAKAKKGLSADDAFALLG